MSQSNYIYYQIQYQQALYFVVSAFGIINWST